MLVFWLLSVAAANYIVPYVPPGEYIADISVRAVKHDVIVKTFVSSKHCGEVCDHWEATLDAMKPYFPEFVFEVEDVDPETMKSNTVVPSSFCGRDTYSDKFKKTMTERNLRRWLLDCKVGTKAFVRNISTLDSSISEDFPVFVHVLSATFPSWHTVPIQRLSSIGFGWTNNSGTKFNNTIVTRNILGVTNMRFDVDKYWELLHVLLPAIIPYWMVETDTGNQVLHYLSRHQVYIFSDEILPLGWHNFAEKHPNTAFIQFRSNETDNYWGNATFPSVSTFEYDHEYVLPSIGPEVQDWLHDVLSMRKEPASRVSNLPAVSHSFLQDVSGATLWPWVREYNNTFLYVYEYDEPCLVRFEEISTNNPAMKFGRLNITENSHETLWKLNDLKNKSVVVSYVNGIVRSVIHCENFDLSTPNLEL